MIKVNSNKFGGIFVEENLLKNSFLDVLKSYVKGEYVKNIDFEVKRNVLKYINIHFSKSTEISKKEELNMYNQLLFLLNTKFQISNKPISFIYEN
ncbi:hypothetical protein [Malacoplasma iowae]|uniref:Uncharacterized protein n=2 Tax=Malacoplasma iowae TaxID=2116 RepID=A0A084U2U1_MALIO|nr:hypothetical protein [Malacoplasma iowae]VEU61956.1 Uncharacterised protein [Mycoplasmopsis fermentans]EGZ31122.1 hypothetical protein GUU_03691 [Malacoplasma iowae 695]KFB07277.1 hypothetical protein P271_104 [Malacoplasma iowae DK-CPA]QHG90040.1 hypothetical protein EER00_04065 [Malacoplasma iowae 695]WPL36229.1 hypothetical protein QX180_02310 [Malacoplasma iowae]